MDCRKDAGLICAEVLNSFCAYYLWQVSNDNKPSQQLILLRARQINEAAAGVTISNNIYEIHFSERRIVAE